MFQLTSLPWKFLYFETGSSAQEHDSEVDRTSRTRGFGDRVDHTGTNTSGEFYLAGTGSRCEGRAFRRVVTLYKPGAAVLSSS